MTQDPQLLIKIKDLHKYYGQGSARNHVLKGIDLDIEQGEFIAIVGTSGSGKTTLLNVLGALDRTYQGVVEISGLNLQQLTDRRLSQLRNEIIGFIFQSFNLLPHLSCAQNVSIPSFFRPHDLNAADVATRVRKLLSSVGLEDKYADRPTELSGGQRQRICIARALFNEPHLILCDEPTGSLDRETGQQIIDLFRSLNRDRRITFIIVTHDENLSQSCDRIIRLADGLIIEDFRQNTQTKNTGHTSEPPKNLTPSLPPLPSTRPALDDLPLSALSSASSLVFPSWLPDACEAPLFNETLSLHCDGHILRFRDTHLDLDRPFSCFLSYSTPDSQPLIHLTLRQQSSHEHPDDPFQVSVSWQELSLSAPCAQNPSALLGLPLRPESFPLTDEDTLRNLVSTLRAAMLRQGADERWF